MSTFLDFDYLKELAVSNPTEFEKVRANEIEKLIQSANEDTQRRLRGIQFQVDAQRKIHKDSPMGACVAISKMMHQSFEGLRCELNQHFNGHDPLSGHSANTNEQVAEKGSARVIQFRG